MGSKPTKRLAMDLDLKIPDKIGDLSVMNTEENLIAAADEKHAAWLAQRLGKFTCSQFHRLMAYEDKATFPIGAETYVMECVTEELTGLPANDQIKSQYIDWGIEHEIEAVKAFEARTRIQTRLTGDNQEFVNYEEDAGGTPDGRIGDDGGIEVKCPKSTTHLKYIRTINCDEDLKKAEKAYYWQIVGCMLVTGAVGWYFISYDPRMIDKNLRLHIVKITRNENEINKLKARLKMASEHKTKAIHDLKEMAMIKSKTQF